MKNEYSECSYNSTPFIYLNGKHRSKFTFTLQIPMLRYIP